MASEVEFANIVLAWLLGGHLDSVAQLYWTFKESFYSIYISFSWMSLKDMLGLIIDTTSKGRIVTNYKIYIMNGRKMVLIDYYIGLNIK